MLDNSENSEIESQTTADVNSSIGSEQFLLNLKKSGNQFIGIQSVLDALDLWNSSVKLYFDAVDYRTSTDALNAWLSCPIGATCFFLGAALLSAFAYLGNGIAKSPEQSELSKQADTCWPYLRDMLKGMKWTFKGTRSVMIVASVLGQYQLINYLTPVGLGLGMLSACNRIWNRGMVEARKSLQEQNDAFRRQIKGIHACFNEVTRDLVWDESGAPRREVLENIYAGSILKVPNANDFSYYHVNDLGHLEDITEEICNTAFINLLNNKLNINKSIYWDDYDSLIKQELSANQIPRFRQVWDQKKVHLEKVLNPNSLVLNFIQTRAAFQTNSREGFASAAFSGLLNAPYYFLGLLSMVTLTHTMFIAALAVCSVFMLLNIAAELYQETDYQRRLRISQLKATLAKTKSLLTIEWQFANLGPHFAQLQPVNNFSLLQELKEIETVLQPHQQLRSILQYCKNDQVLRPDLGDDYLQICNKVDQGDFGGLSPTQKDTLKHCIKMTKYRQDYEQQNAELKNQLCLSTGSIWWQGLRNGLVVFGAFNSLLMSIASMNLLFGIGFTPMFFYASIIAGITLLFFTTLYTWLSIEPNEEDSLFLNGTAAPIREDTVAADLASQSSERKSFMPKFVAECYDAPDIQASKNLLISEHSEVFRQLLSGFKKGIKFLQTLSVFMLPLTNNDSILTKLCYIGTGFVFSIFFALKGLRGLMRVDEAAYKNSFIYQGLTGCKPIEPLPKLQRVTSQTISASLELNLTNRASPSLS